MKDFTTRATPSPTPRDGPVAEEDVTEEEAQDAASAQDGTEVATAQETVLIGSSKRHVSEEAETAQVDVGEVPTLDASGEAEDPRPDNPETESSDDTHETDDPDNGRRPRGLRIGIAVLSLLTVALLVLGVVYLVQTRSNAQDEQARADAVRVASEQTTNLLSVNSGNVEGQLSSLVDNATGDFRRQFEGVRKTFGDVVRQGKVDSKGKVDSAAVDQLNGDKARVLLALSSTVSNAQAGKPDQRQYRITVDLERKEDRWLVAGMQFVP